MQAKRRKSLLIEFGDKSWETKLACSYAHINSQEPARTSGLMAVWCARVTKNNNSNDNNKFDELYPESGTFECDEDESTPTL